MRTSFLTPLVAAAIAALPAVAMAAPAGPAAQWRTNELADPFGAAAIENGRYDAVEKRLDGAFARGDRTTEVLLNLAAINLKRGQTGTAQDLYRMVLQQPDANMATRSGSAWSHAIARRGLTGTTMASR